MSAISLKSITGITSITTPSGVDNQLTLHTNNTTERVKIDVAGNVHINNHLAVAGISTFTGNVLIPNDTGKILVGASQDLQFYHDYSGGSENSHIAQTTGKHLQITAYTTFNRITGTWGVIKESNSHNIIRATAGSDVKLYFNNGEKLATAGHGINITGGFVATGDCSIADKITHAGDENTSIRFPAVDTFTVETAGDERLRIQPNGRVGVNINSPETLFHIEQDNAHSSTYYLNTDAAILVDNKNGSGKAVIKLEHDAALVYGSGSASFIIADRENERLRITSGGQVNIGGNYAETSHPFNISHSTKPSLALHTGTTLRADLSATTGITSIRSYANSPFTVNIGGSGETEAFRITGSGKIKLGSGGDVVGSANVEIRYDDPVLLIRDTAESSADGDAKIAFGNNTHYPTAYISHTWDGNDGSLTFHTRVGGSEAERLRVKSDGTVSYRTGGGKGYEFNSSGSSASTAANVFAPASYTLAFGTNGNERLRIDSNGHLHTGYTSSFGNDHINILATDGGGISIATNNAGNASTNDVLGSLSFQGYLNTQTHTNAEAKISGVAAANHTGSSAATDMVFYTKPSTTGPGSAPTERFRIKSDGNILFTKTSANPNFTLSRNASIGNDNQAIGTIDFASNTAHTVQARLMGKNHGTNNVGGYLVVETRVENGSLTEKLRITGIGDIYAGNADTGGYAFFDNSTLRPRYQFRQGTGTHRGFAIIETRGDANGQDVFIAKSREGNGTGLITAGDNLGKINFAGADGTNMVNGATIFAYTEATATVAADRMPTNLSFRTHDDNTSGTVERFRITHDGYLNFYNDSNTAKGLRWYNNVGGSAKAASIEWGNGSANWQFKHFRNDNQADNPYANIDFYTGDWTNPTRALRITNDGNHIREKHSRFATRVQYDSGNEAVDEILDFSTPHINVGNDFDASNNYYVAPVDGDYCFFFFTNVAGSSSAYYVNFDVNGSEISSTSGGRIYDQHGGSGWQNLSGCIMLSLQEGDQVRIRNRVAMNFDGGSYGQFMGWLVG